MDNAAQNGHLDVIQWGSMQTAIQDALKLPWTGQQVKGTWMWSRGCIQIAERGALKEQ